MADATEDATPDGEALRREGERWLGRIQAAEKREKEWRDEAVAAERAYACDTGPDAGNGKLYDFNILHSNVETIVPAIYNSTPVPDVRRRFLLASGEEPQPPQQQEGQPPDPRALMAFQQAALAWQAKRQQDADAKAYGDMIERAITVQIDDNRLDGEIESEARDSFLAGRGIVRLRFRADDTGEALSNERVTFEAVSWRDFRMGLAKRWEDVPWVAFRHMMPAEDERDFADAAMLAAQRRHGDTIPGSADGGSDADDDICVWEIWCKRSRSCKFVRENDGKIIRIVDDPLGLRGFFPMPPPVQPITLTGKMTPVCPFAIYRKLADELDLCTKRINAIMSGLKVRGLTVGDASALLRLSELDDNEIGVEQNLEQLAQTGGLEKAVIWWPIEQAIKVLKELYVQREQTKSAIYEITGISDIVRGASDPRETMGAQEIKTQWGALRIRKVQRLIERQVRDVFAIMAEIITTKFSIETLVQMTGIEMTDGIVALMRQPVLAAYRVDVESDSTVKADMTRQKGEMAEFMRGTAEYFGTMGPLVQGAPDMAEPIADLYGAFANVYKLGRQAEDAVERMSKTAKQAATNRQGNPEAEAKSAELQIKLESEKAKAAIEVEKLQLETRKAEAELRIKEAELALKRDELRLKGIQGAAEIALEASQQRPVAVGE